MDSSHPGLTAVTFEYRLHGEDHQSSIHLFEPEEQALSSWLNDVDRDFNVELKGLVENPRLVMGTVTIAWTDSIRANLPLPISQGAGLPSIAISCVGDLIECITQLMKESGKFEGLSAQDNMMLTVAARASRNRFL